MNLETDETLVIPLSRTKIVALLVGAIALVGLSLWLWTVADGHSRFHPLLMKATSVAGVAFFGLCALYTCVKIFDRKPGLVIDKEGIEDNSSAVAAGRIPWHQIVGIRLGEIHRQRFLIIDVVDPRPYLDRCGFFKRMLISESLNMTGSPISISSNTLDISFDDLQRALVAGFQRYHEKASNGSQEPSR